MAQLTVRLLGSFQVALAGEAAIGFSTDKARALLAYLVAEADRPHRREALAGLLWPDYPERSARISLRTALANVRQVIGDVDADPPYLNISRQTVQLNPEGNVWSDVTAFADCLATGLMPDEPEGQCKIGQLEQAVALYRGQFLEGFTLADSQPFEEWALLTREQLERQALHALQLLADHYEGCGDFQRALDCLWRHVELDPWQEATQGQLMRLLALSGQREAAVTQYEAYRQLLTAELDLEPSEEIQETYERLLKGELLTGRPAAPRAVDREPRTVGECPYRGLAAFREADAPFFFGRDDFSEKLFQAVHARAVVAVIVGSSGSGKSSVVYAGLVPRLRDTREWLIASFRPGGEPFRSLAAALIPLLEPELGETDRLIETHKLAGALRDGGVNLYPVVERAVEKDLGSADAGSRHALLLIDQFEELYTLCSDPDTRRGFLETLLAAAEAGSARRPSPFVLLLNLRADFMGQALAHRPFTDVLQAGALLLGPMIREELREAIEKPAGKQGAALEEGLVERLLDDVGEEPGKLPLLEFALTLLWERLDRGWMTHAAYEKIGRVDGALARYAEEVFDELTEGEQETARRIFVQLVQPGEGTEDTRRVATRAELGGADATWSLVQHLADQRLVVSGRNASTGSETVEVVHEALIQRWGTLRGWMEADRAFRIWQEGLRAALRAWEASGQDEGALLRGGPLTQAEAWLAERESELSPAEATFIEVGVALRERQQLERERRRRRTILALAGGLVAALVLALLVGQQWRRAEEEVDARTAAEALALAQREEVLRQAGAGLAAKALAELEGSVPERGVLLALAALERFPYTPQAESALAQAVETPVPQLALRWDYYTWAAAWSPDGERIAAAAETAVLMWDAYMGTQWGEIAFGPSSYYCNGRDLAWSPDGSRFVAFGEALGTFVDKDCALPRVWDVATRTQLITFTGHMGQPHSIDWSPDGAYIVSAGEDGAARIWDADTGVERLTLDGHAAGINDAVWSPGGERIVTAGADGTAKVWEVKTPLALSEAQSQGTSAGTEEEPLTLSAHAGGVNGAAWSPDGDRLATAGADGLVRVWLLPRTASAPGEILFTLAGHSDEVRGVAWSPDGERIATSSVDGTVRLWDAETGEQLRTLYGLVDDLRNVAWSPSGDRLVVGGGTMLPVWDVSERPLRLAGHTDDVWDAQWSPDGQRVGTSSYDGTARIWDATTGEELLVLEHPDGVRFFAWSPDGARIVTTCQDGFARVWDTRSGELLLEVSAPEGDFFFVASWSPDGSRIAASRSSGGFTIYDVATGDSLLSFDTEAVAIRLPWSPDGDRILTGITPMVWDTSTGAPLVELGDGGINAEWSPDGGRIVLSQHFGRAEIFDATTGEELLLFTAHSNDVWHAMWSPNGKRIVSGDESGEVKVWDAATGDVVLSFRAPGAVYSVHWSPDGQYVIAGGYFNPPVVRRAWQSTEELIAYAKACCVRRDLTTGERRQFGVPER